MPDFGDDFSRDFDIKPYAQKAVNPFALEYREHRLLQKGVKPVGPVELDRNNYLGKIIEDCWLFRPDYGFGALNLGGDVRANLLPSATTNLLRYSVNPPLVDGGAAPQRHPNIGLHRDFAVDGGGIMPFVGYNEGSPKNYGTEYTICVVHSASTSVGNVSGPCGSGYTQGYFIDSRYHAASSKVKRFNVIGDFNGPYGSFLTTTLVRKGAVLKLYFNGELFQTISDFDASAEYKAIGVGSPDSKFSPRQGMILCWVIRKYINETGVRKSYEDPYQFLKVKA